MGRLVRLVLAGALVASLAAGCASGSSKRADGKVSVVAAESFWGSIASQLGGDKVSVTSVVSNPATDPHDYEATPADGRAIADARYVIDNGLGYDAWVQQLVDANADASRKVLDVGRLVGLDDGANPHRWYSPSDVEHVVAQITADLKALAPDDAAYFDQQHASFEAALAPYRSVIAEIKAAFAGTPVGASESIFTPLSEALGLDLVTPESFLDAISEGNDPTAADKATVDRQIERRAIKLFVYNGQNATPDVQRLVAAARNAGIPTVTVTETLVPPDASFQDWQVAQLRAIDGALRG